MAEQHFLRPPQKLPSFATFLALLTVPKRHWPQPSRTFLALYRVCCITILLSRNTGGERSEEAQTPLSFIFLQTCLSAAHCCPQSVLLCTPRSSVSSATMLPQWIRPICLISTMEMRTFSLPTASASHPSASDHNLALGNGSQPHHSRPEVTARRFGSAFPSKM